MYHFAIVLLLWVHVCTAVSWKLWNQAIEKRPQVDGIATKDARYQKRQDSHSIDLISGPKVSIGPTTSQIINTTWIYAPGSISTKVQGDMYFWSGLYGDEIHDDEDSLRVTNSFAFGRLLKCLHLIDCY
jgi:hypothetical protein